MNDKVEEKRALAHLNNARISNRKVKIVADIIRNKPVDEALNILAYTPKAASRLLYKLLASAKANAVNNHNMEAEKLYVSKIFANEGPSLKRVRPAAKGTANRVLKRTSHITIEVKERV